MILKLIVTNRRTRLRVDSSRSEWESVVSCCDRTFMMMNVLTGRATVNSVKNDSTPSIKKCIFVSRSFLSVLTSTINLILTRTFE
jgi:hypothetical protein